MEDTVNKEQLALFQELFRGRAGCYGQWSPGTPKTVKGAAPDVVWKNHLLGRGPRLGIVPIMEDEGCYFGAIDWDNDSADIIELSNRVATLNIPATDYTVKDSDDAVITYSTLLRFVIEKDLASILAYEEKDHFRCFDLEVNPSISANILILDALKQAGLGRNILSVQNILHYIERQRGAILTGWINGMPPRITQMRMQS